MLDKKIPFKQANEADVVVTAYPEGKLDEFIDSTLVVGLYDKSNWFILASCVSLSLHTM